MLAANHIDMRAAVLRQPGQPLAVEQVRLSPPREGEILVRVKAAGVCHSDLHYMVGDIGCRLPVILGHEGSGVVEAVGPGSRGWVTVGDRVALTWRPRCSQCPQCLAGNPVLCERGAVQATTGGLLDGESRLSDASGDAMHHFLGVSCFAEYAVVSEQSVVKVPDGVPDDIAAISSCAVVTGVGAALNVVENAAGKAIVIIGLGGVGLSAVLGARLVGAEPIVVVDLDPRKLALGRDLGATHTVDPADGDVVEQVMSIVPGGAPWVLEAVGLPQTMTQAFHCLGPRGTLVALGLGKVDATCSIPVNLLVQRQRRIVGSLYGSANPAIDLPRIYRLYESGKLPLDLLRGRTFGLDQVNEAFDDLAMALGRGVIQP